MGVSQKVQNFAFNFQSRTARPHSSGTMPCIRPAEPPPGVPPGAMNSRRLNRSLVFVADLSAVYF
jgi:hypothetical protein